MPYRRHLDVIHIAEPCSERWDRMGGDERVRFCAKCRKNVYHLSALTPGEVEDLVRFHEGNLCVRFALRADGTIVTAEPPTCADARRGERARVRRRVLVGVVGAAIGAAATAIASTAAPRGGPEPAVVAAARPESSDPFAFERRVGPPSYIPGPELAPSLLPDSSMDLEDFAREFPEFMGGFGGLGLRRP